MTLVLAVLLAAGAAAALTGRDPSGRLGSLVARDASASVPAPGRGRVPPVQAACALLGLSLALVVAAPVGPALGLAAALGGPRLLAGLEPRQVRRERERLLADLPLLLDLLASCLVGGAALPQAARAVALAVEGPGGRRLAAVSAALEVGTPVTQAWQALAGRAPDDPLAPAARALSRAADGGAPVAAAVARLASEARADAMSRAEQAARRVGVFAVAPLGLCFLPAFVLIGIVPLVAGLAGPLLSTP